MSALSPVAFDIETSGLDEAVITVAGFRDRRGSWMVLNTDGRPADGSTIAGAVESDADVEAPIEVRVVTTERALLEAMAEYVERLDGGSYLTAYNGETWNGGFDLPFVRSACLRNDVPWPFDDLPYADTMEAIQRFDTGDVHDLAGVYDRLIGDEHCDPFDESGAAVTAWRAGEWVPLLEHNLADIERTRELAVLAGRYVPKSDFSMKNLTPPQG